ncbi:MAG: CAAX prenyl protease-related protein [Thermodesulfobacteria bacterium]|nr:CAAX prenyl protease-related protein [Thermodesulfobacteriota bacterium]
MAKARHYIIPFALFLILTEIGRLFPAYPFVIYALKTFLVGALLWFWRHKFRELYLSPRIAELGWAVLAGLVVCVVWIGGEAYFPQIGKSSALSPFEQEISTAAIWFTIILRLFGAAVVVPVMEELFWRSFLMRYLIHRDFQQIPLGTYTHFSFWAVVFLFALEHFRIVPGAFAGAVYGALLCLTKNIWVPIVAHAVTNLALGLYVLYTGSWGFW